MRESKRAVFLLALSLTFVSGLTVNSPALSKPSAASKMQLGELLFFNGNVDGAINAFRQAIILNPKMWEAHKNLINLYAQKQDMDSAISECREVLKIKPNEKETHQILSSLLRNKGDVNGSVEELQASGASPVMVNTAIGLMHLQNGNFAEAEKHIRLVLEKQPDNADSHLTLGVVLFKTGKKPEAIQEIDQAIKYKGKYPEAHNAKADMLASDQKWKEALQEYDKAIEEEPKYAQAYASKANAHFNLGDTEGALGAYAKARELNPNDKNNIYGHALLLEKTGKTYDAIQAFEAGLALDNDPQMVGQIQSHLNQLKGVPASSTTGLFSGSDGGGLMGNYKLDGSSTGGGAGVNSNPFGHSFSDMIKVQDPATSAKNEKSSNGTNAKMIKVQVPAANANANANANAKKEKSKPANSAKTGSSG